MRGARCRTSISARASRGALVLASLLALASSAAASRTVAPRTEAGGNELVVGAVLDLSAGWTSLGRASRVTLRLAVADANAALARSGSQMRVRLRILDTRGAPAGAVRAVRTLEREGVRVAIGPQTSSGVKAVRNIVRRLGVVVVSQGSTAHSLAIAGDNVFRFVPDDIREGEALVALLRRGRIDGIVPVWRRDPGNAGLAVSVRRHFKAAGGKVANGVPYGESTKAFSVVASSLAAQVAALRAAGARRVGVYLAGFDEVVDLFRAARLNPALQSLPWYGSDGVALTTRLVRDPVAAAFAHDVGYPNPTVGLPDAVLRRARPLIARVRARLGREPDAFALTAYDALRIAVDARQRAGTDAASSLRRALVAAANAHVGVTGKMALNRAGDRAYGSYDFWSVCPAGRAFAWKRTFTYAATSVGRGRIAIRSRC